MYYYHEEIFMPNFDFDIDFWRHIDFLAFSGHAGMRAHMRVFPLLSLEKVRSDGHIYEVGIDEKGISLVCLFVPMGEGRNLIYVINRSGLIITGWYNPSTWTPRPALKKRIYEKN